MLKELKNYTIISKIASGGMSEVYLAIDTNTGKEVALKILDPKLSIDPEYIHRFKKEASISSQLNHKNIVKILSFGTFKDNYYIAYEYIEGITLDKYIKQKSLSISEIEDISIQILEALYYAHSNNIIHRDIKPSNIMIAKGTVKILDFGIAKQELAATVTKTGLFMGSPHYVSPEQIEGHDIDYRSDIYSFGIVLYEMIEGKVPFSSDTPWGIIRAHLDKSIPEITRDAPTYLKEIVKKCLFKKKEYRFRSAQEIIYLIKNKEEPEEDKTVMIERGKILAGKELDNEDYEYERKKKEKKPKKFIKIFVPIICFFVIYFGIGIGFFIAGHRFYNKKDFISAAYNFNISRKFLIPKSKYNFIVSIDEFANYNIYSFVKDGSFQKAQKNLNAIEKKFPDYPNYKEIENKYNIELKIKSSSDQLEVKNYGLAQEFIKDALILDPNNEIAKKLYNEINAKVEQYNSFLNEINSIDSLYRQGSLNSAYDKVNKLIKNAEFNDAVSDSDKKKLQELLRNIYHDGKDKIGSNNSLYFSAYHDEKYKEFKNIFGEEIIRVFFIPMGSAVDSPKNNTSYKISIGDAPDLILYSTSELYYSDTGESLFTRDKKENPNATLAVAKLGNSWLIDVNNYRFVVEVVELKVKNYWFEELKISVTANNV